jgi:hypothetical protein
MIESMDKRMDCRFNSTRAAALRNSSSPLYKGTLICSEDLSISFHSKKVLEMRQCWAVGFSILELSKHHMQSLYYDRIVPSLGKGNVAVVMSDTDSFLLVTNHESEDEVMRRLSPVMDFANLPPAHPLHDSSRHRVPGYLKNEVPRASILEAVALKSKTYALRTDAGEMMSKAKGVTQASKREISFDLYRECIRQLGQVEVDERTLRSTKHVNQLLRSRKVAFSSFDDKRHLLCPRHSVPYGSVLLKLGGEGGRCFFCLYPDRLY